MSVIFNQTFSADKPIYYPANWGSGKTAEQQYDEFKATFAFWLLRNILETLLGTVWVFLYYVLLEGAREINRYS